MNLHLPKAVHHLFSKRKPKRKAFKRCSQGTTSDNKKTGKASWTHEISWLWLLAVVGAGRLWDRISPLVLRMKSMVLVQINSLTYRASRLMSQWKLIRSMQETISTIRVLKTISTGKTQMLTAWMRHLIRQEKRSKLVVSIKAHLLCRLLAKYNRVIRFQ